MVLLSVLDIILIVVGGAGMVYQAVCILISLFTKPVRFPEAPMDKRYAVLISARNEENVIGNLITCIQTQTYPKELIDIWLVADNCTDATAEVARGMGCHVIERFDQRLIGKGYALTYLLDRMNESGASDPYDAFFVFDADNKLDRNYFEEMNKAFQSGFKILGNSCHVGGTGFMFSQEIMRRNNGWKFHLLTEDLEFTMDSVLHGDRIGYCGTAILYDEQPVTFSQSWRQRLRWSKGFLQVFRYYGPALIKRAIRERDFSAVDFTLLLCPFTVLGIARILLGLLFALCGFVTWQSQLNSLTGWTSGIVMSVVGMMGLAALTIIVERDHVGATNKELFAYVLSFPIYMFSYVPISFQAVFSKAEWKPIEHKG